ncbi:hypothetical protein [Pedobacter sp. Hv1]|uniref:hypothetical protein n=1 Tax=Pedobacter sp. Hv1 TaxID=1740090 RepID=UPI000ACB17B5|nr:hypothetical protein [Pedobacter sp. Hv1]
MEPHLRSLEDKLRMLAAGEAIGLTAAEAAVYGVEYADMLPEPEQSSQEVEDYGE